MSTTNHSITLPPHEITSRAAAILAGNAAGDRSRQHAFNKAAFMLAREAVEIVHSFDGFLITSASRVGVVHRVSHMHGCSCEAGANGRYCWHAAIVEVLEEAGKYTMPALPANLSVAEARTQVAEMRRRADAILAASTADRIAAARSERYAAALADMNELFA